MDFIVESSARHLHVTREALDILYGKGYELTRKKDLSQPGQFLSEEKLTVVGPKGEFSMSIIGPVRKYVQVELSLTDARKIGLTIPIRESGDLHDAAPCKIIGPCGEIEVEHAVIASKRHLHALEKDAKELGVNNGDIVKVEVDSKERRTIFDDVVVRVTDASALAFHIDTDEANAAYFGTLTKGRIVK